MKILVHHGKHGDAIYDISTDTLRGNAYRHLFDELGSVGYYDGPAQEVDEEELFDKAAAGDDEAVIKFMQLRSRRGYEYEGIEEVIPAQIGSDGKPMV